MDYERGGTQKDFYASDEVVGVSCPLCQGAGFKKIYQERGALGIVRCKGCGLIYVNPRLKDPEKIYWGSPEKYFEEARLIFEGKSAHHRDSNYLSDLKLIARYKPSGNFLDVGANMGFFLRLARNRCWDLYGIEPSAALAEIAKKYFGLNIRVGFLEGAAFQRNFFDVVTMTDVFEHIPEPKALLIEIRRVLKPSGILFIKVPNANFNLFKLRIAAVLGRLKQHDIFDSYEHVVHYCEKTLKNMLEGAGFRVVEFRIGAPIQIPVWHNYVGHYYAYPSPWRMDPFRHSLRTALYFLSLLEFKLRLNHIGFLAPNIIAIAKKIN